jgi:hypothetical protein
MTTANMKLVTLDVPLEGEMKRPEQNLEDGEFIVSRVVEVKNLYGVLKGMSYSLAVPQFRSQNNEYESFPTRTQRIL